jgi:vitamin B12 transporter
VKLAPALLLAVLANGQSTNQERPKIEPTVVTVAGEALPLSATSASVTVLTREAIDNSRADNVADLLRQVPFLEMAQTGGRGGLTTITVRGGKPNFTMVMIDGIPINDISDLLGGSYDFSTLSTATIDQVEIVRGPLSSLYGSDAVAGVINVIPRRGESKSSLEAGVMLGNFTTREGRIEAAGKIRNFDYALGGSYLGVGEQVSKDPFRLGTISFNSHLALGSDKLIRFLARYQNSEARGFPPNGGGPEDSILRDPQDQNVGELVVGLGWKHQATSSWLYGLDVDLFHRNQDAFTPAILDRIPPTFRSVPAERSRTHFERLRAGFSNSLRLSSQLSADFGVGVRREDGTNNTIVAANTPDLFHLTRSTLDGGGELLYRSGRWTANLGARADKSDGFRTVFSPRAGLSFRTAERGPRLKATWGRGFMQPSFFALGDRLVGNPLLKPEFSRSFDVGAEQALYRNHAALSVTAFRNDYRDLVDFSAQQFKLVNRTQAETHGVEFALAISPNRRLHFTGHVSYLDWKLVNTTEPLRDQPHWRGGVSADWKPGKRWFAHAETLWVGPRYDFQVPVPAQGVVGGYSGSNVVVSREFSNRVNAYVRIENIFNRRYHEFVGFPNPGIYAKIGVNYRFR